MDQVIPLNETNSLWALVNIQTAVTKASTIWVVHAWASAACRAVVCKQVLVPWVDQCDDGWQGAWERLSGIEDLQGETSVGSFRLSVPGGWVVMDIVYRDGTGVDLSLIFINEPDHCWKLTS